MTHRKDWYARLAPYGRAFTPTAILVIIGHFILNAREIRVHPGIVVLAMIAATTVVGFCIQWWNALPKEKKVKKQSVRPWLRNFPGS